MLCIELAKKHVHNGAIMQPSAVFCLKEAEKHEKMGNTKNAKVWAVKSLAYSIGIFSPDYKTANANNSTNQEGEMRMSTIREVYNPLIKAALADDTRALFMLAEVGLEIFKANPEKCKSVDDGVEAAKRNLDYYCQYFDEKTANKVKEVYCLGQGFRDLAGCKHNFI